MTALKLGQLLKQALEAQQQLKYALEALHVISSKTDQLQERTALNCRK